MHNKSRKFKKKIVSKIHEIIHHIQSFGAPKVLSDTLFTLITHARVVSTNPKVS